MDEPRKSLRRHIIGFVGAVSIGCAAPLYPSDVAAASTLYGLVIEAQGAPVFGSVDPATGSFTRIGSASVPEGHYAPVFDPARNAFYLTSAPIDKSLFSARIDEIDATTGALTQISLPPLGGLIGQFVAGVGVASASTSTPEPTSIMQLLKYIFGMAVVIRRAPRAAMTETEHA